MIEGSHFLSAFAWWTPLFLVFLLARFVWWLGGAGFSVIQAYIADISSPTERMKNMGLMGAAFGIAFLVGPALSGVLSNFISSRDIIMITFFVIFANVVLIYMFLQEPKKHVDTNWLHIADFHFSRVVLILLFLSFGSTLAFAAIQAMSTQFYADRFSFSATQIGYTMAMVGLVAVLYQAWLVKYVRRYLDEYQMLTFAFVILVIGFAGFSLNESPVWLFFWVIFFPLGMGSFNPAVGSLLSKTAGKEIGKVMGYNTSIQSIWQIAGPILAGLLYVTPGTNAPFLASAAIFVVLLSISLTLKK
jgi:MFS transporter, DHA1 family, tetracycline resistance protein